MIAATSWQVRFACPFCWFLYSFWRELLYKNRWHWTPILMLLDSRRFPSLNKHCEMSKWVAFIFERKHYNVSEMPLCYYYQYLKLVFWIRRGENWLNRTCFYKNVKWRHRSKFFKAIFTFWCFNSNGACTSWALIISLINDDVLMLSNHTLDQSIDRHVMNKIFFYTFTNEKREEFTSHAG